MPTGASDDEVVAQVLARYQLAVATGDRRQFASVFHPDATVSYPDPHTSVLVTATGTAFADEVATMVEAGTPVKEETVELHIDVSGTVAVARVDFFLRLGDESFVGTDFFSLAKLGDAWFIVQKLYDMSPSGDPESEQPATS